MRAAFSIAAKDLRLRLRDRSALMLAFVAPVAIASIISAAFPSDMFDFSARIAYVDLDGGVVSRAFRAQVLDDPQLDDQIDVVDARTEAAARRLVEQDEAGAAIVVPQGFEAAVRRGEQATLTVFGNRESEVAAGIAGSLARGFAAEVGATRLAVAAAVQESGDLSRIAELAAAAARERIPVQLADAGVGGIEVTGANAFGPAMAVLFLYFTVGFGVRSLAAEREEGTLARLVAAPSGIRAVFVAKGIVVVVLGMASLAVLFGFLSLVFGARWGDPVALAAMSLATVLAVLGVTAAVQASARTSAGGDAASQMLALVFSLIGGSFLPVSTLPDVLQKVSVVTPNRWAIDGITDLVYDGGGVASVAQPLAVLFGIALAGTALAVVRLSHRPVR